MFRQYAMKSNKIALGIWHLKGALRTSTFHDWWCSTYTQILSFWRIQWLLMDPLLVVLLLQGLIHWNSATFSSCLCYNKSTVVETIRQLWKTVSLMIDNPQNTGGPNAYNLFGQTQRTVGLPFEQQANGIPN